MKDNLRQSFAEASLPTARHMLGVAEKALPPKGDRYYWIKGITSLAGLRSMVVKFRNWDHFILDDAQIKKEDYLEFLKELFGGSGTVSLTKGRTTPRAR